MASGLINKDCIICKLCVNHTQQVLFNIVYLVIAIIIIWYCIYDENRIN
jgi:hypothetical protein